MVTGLYTTRWVEVGQSATEAVMAGSGVPSASGFNRLQAASSLLKCPPMRLPRLLPLLAVALLSACPGQVPPRDGDGDEVDASLSDPPDGGSGGTIDAPLGSADAPPGSADARPQTDANTSVDAATTCVANGLSGTCLDTQVCAGLGKQSVPGFCPGPTNIQCCVPVQSQPSLCQTDPRPQPNGGLEEEPGVEGCPDGMLRIHTGDDSFCVDRFEASLDLVAGDGSTSPWSPFFNPGTAKVVARSLRGAVPQGYITGEQAKAACAEAGKRLCTDVEWQRACGGPDNTTYPYGPTRMPGVCNDARSQHPAVQLFGSVTNLNSPCINQLEDGLERTGAHTGCVTAEGAFDMMGNLHEWTADPNGTFRGGFYVDTVINGPGCRYATTAHNTLHHDYSTGFRCCAD
jgi:formylglycine-generating enzyme